MTNSQLRQTIRNFLLTATFEECMVEFKISKERGDTFRMEVIREWIGEEFPDKPHFKL